jgi:Tfp pilus assembly protein PilN
VTMFVDLVPSSFRAAGRARRRARMWVSAYALAAAGITTGYFVVSAGHAHATATRDDLARQLQQEWDRNKEAQRLLSEIHAVEEAVTRYDRLAAPVRTVDVVGTLGGLLPTNITLTALTMAPRSEKITIKPPQPPPGATAATAPGTPPAKPTSRTMNYLAVEVEGVAPSDADLAGLVSALEGCDLFVNVGMDYARSTSVDGTPARSFRVSARVDFGRHYAFKGANSQTPDATASAKAEAPLTGDDATASASEGVTP